MATTTARVTPYRPVKSISAETTFGQDTALGQQAVRGGARALRQGRAPSSRARASRAAASSSSSRPPISSILTRSRRLAHPTQRAALIFESIAALIEREADGRTFRLIGVGVADLRPGHGADPADLFTFAGCAGEKHDTTQAKP